MDDTFTETPLTPSSQRRLEEDRSVSRMQRLYPGKLRDLCQMHLAFILDFSDSKLEMMLDDTATSCKKKLGLGSMFKPKDKSNGSLFGAPLSDGGVQLMMPLIRFLKKGDNLKKEGLFRKAGNGRKMKMLKEQLVAQGEEIVIDEEMFGSHDVACVLKEFLRELPEPLLTYKHMEAHRQIRALGLHAKTGEKEKYFNKKLKAIQYLMRLIPVPVQKMVRQLMKLLHKVSSEPETKMTAETLGTIFAPICCLSRKAAATDVCDIVGETEPTVAFMIENARRLFEVPRELVVDVISFWKEMEKFSMEENNCENVSQSTNKMKRWPSGPIVNTAVCYADRRASQNSDSASTTQTELANLLAHVQSLPDTPANMRLKRQIQKGCSTPASSEKVHHRSKSIGASIKRRLPTLGRSKNKYCAAEFSIMSSGGSYKSVDCLADAPINMCDLLDSPASSRGRSLSRESRPRHKRPLMQSCENVAPECTPTKLERRARSSDCHILSPKENVCPSSSRRKHNSKHGPDCSLGNCKCGMSFANLNTPSQSEESSSNSSLSPVDGSVLCYSSISDTEQHDFIPYHHNSLVAVVETPDKENQENSPLPIRKFRPATPIAKRAKLTFALNGFETAI